MTAFLILRNKILIPLLAGAEKRMSKPRNIFEIDSHYKNIQSEMQEIFRFCIWSVYFYQLWFTSS